MSRSGICCWGLTVSMLASLWWAVWKLSWWAMSYFYDISYISVKWSNKSLIYFKSWMPRPLLTQIGNLCFPLNILNIRDINKLVYVWKVERIDVFCISATRLEFLNCKTTIRNLSEWTVVNFRTIFCTCFIINWVSSINIYLHDFITKCKGISPIFK